MSPAAAQGVQTRVQPVSSDADVQATERNGEPSMKPAAKKAGWLQVASTMFWGLLMIGKKGTWEKDGATITLPQAVVGAVVAGIVVILLLVAIVKLVLR